MNPEGAGNKGRHEGEKREAMSAASDPKPPGRVRGMVATVAWWLKTKAVAYAVKGLAAALCLGVVFHASVTIGLTIWPYDKVAGEGGETFALVPACLILAGLFVRLNIVSVLALPFCLLLIDGTFRALDGLRFLPVYLRSAFEMDLLYSAVILIMNLLAWLVRIAGIFPFRNSARRRGE